MKHTQEPWVFDQEKMKIKGSGDFNGHDVIANVSSQMNYSRGNTTQCLNAQRIVECVNALEGIEGEQMLNLVIESKKYQEIKEVLENMIERLDQGRILTLRKDSVIIEALRNSINK